MRTAAASWVSLAFQVGEHCGLSRQSMLSGLAAESALFEDPDARIPLRIADALVERIAEHLDATGGAWQLATRNHQPLVRDCLFFLCTHARDVRHYFELLARYARLNSDGAHVSIEHREGEVEIAFELTDAGSRPLPARRLAHAAWVIASVRRARLASQRAFAPRSIGVAAPAPTTLDGIEALLGVLPAFDQPRSCIVFDHAMLELPFPAADPVLFSAVEQRARALLASLPPVDDLRAQVRAAVRADLQRREHEPSLAKVARTLGRAERSLQRQLQHEGASFRTLVDEARRELALQLVEHGSLSVAEVAERVGFDSPSAFTKRFRQWTGRSPGEHRSALRG